jgi:hypothetical protein
MFVRALIAAVALAGVAAPAVADKSYRFTFEGREIKVIRVSREPLGPIVGGGSNAPPSSEAMRVANALDSAQALRALEIFCAMPPGQLLDFGAYGDPLWFDRQAAHWVVWFDCAPRSAR